MSSTTDAASPSTPLHKQPTRSGIPVRKSSTVAQSRSPARQTTRPSLHPQRPSWVGPIPPSRPTTPGIPIMTQKVKITFSSAGLQPPVYFAGSLGPQPWEPVEMKYTQTENGEHEFWQEFDAEEGEYQYKFRLGPGDWWVLDEDKSIVDDGAGNRNNLLIVKPQSPRDSLLGSNATEQAAKAEKPQSDAPLKVSDPVEIHVSQASEDVPEQANEQPLTAPAQAQEQTQSSVNHEQELSSTHDKPSPQPTSQPEPASEPDKTHSRMPELDEQDVDVEQAPAFAHEAAPSSSVKIANEIPHNVSEDHSPLFNHESAAANSANSIHLDVFDDDENDVDDEAIASPLLRHETLAPIITRQDDDDEGNSAPLLPHESLSPLEARSSNRSARSNSASSHKSNPFFEDEDINDPSLEKFPTQRDDIMAHLQRTGSRLHEDDAALEVPALSPTLSTTRSLSAGASPSLSTTWESSDHLDCIDETEELSPVDATTTEGLGIEPTKDSAIPSDAQETPKPLESDKKEATQKLSISPSHEPVNLGPLTPPMTPIDEPQKKVGLSNASVADGKTESPLRPKSLSSTDREDNSTNDVVEPSAPKATVGSGNAKDDNVKISSFWNWVSRVCGGRLSTVGIAVAVGVAAAFYAITGRVTGKASP